MKIDFVSTDDASNKDIIFDAISVTANFKGFTVLRGVTSRFKWDEKLIEKAASECNTKRQVCIVDLVNPILLLVPKTKAKDSVADLALDLVKAADTIGIRNLYFTHYAHIFNKLPKGEIVEILTTFLNPNLQIRLESIFWQIDKSAYNEMTDIYKLVMKNLDC